MNVVTLVLKSVTLSTVCENSSLTQPQQQASTRVALCAFGFVFFLLWHAFPPNIFIVQALVLDIPSGLSGWSSECRHLLHPCAGPSLFLFVCFLQ